MWVTAKRGYCASAFSIPQRRIMPFPNDIIPNFVDIILLTGYNVLVKLCVEVSHYGGNDLGQRGGSALEYNGA